MFKPLDHGNEICRGYEMNWIDRGVRFTILVAGGMLLWLMLSLAGCASPQKEYVVDYTRGNDVTAQGSRERPCQTEVQCQRLADRHGVRSYWMVYQ